MEEEGNNPDQNGKRLGLFLEDNHRRETKVRKACRDDEDFTLVSQGIIDKEVARQTAGFWEQQKIKVLREIQAKAVLARQEILNAIEERERQKIK